MYPSTFFGLFPAFPLDLRAFVAMSFDARFISRWETILRPAIARVLLNGQPLDPHRIDLALSGDSVVTGILDNISRCRIVVADITSIGRHDNRVARNENVFYEVGLAHAVRLPEEVVMFRSDHDPLAFDISNVRVHLYDPEGNAEAARTMVTNVIDGSLKELALRRHVSIRRAADALDHASLCVLGEARQSRGAPPRYRYSVTPTSAQMENERFRFDGMRRLLDLAAIRADFTGTADPRARFPLSNDAVRRRIIHIRLRNRECGPGR